MIDGNHPYLNAAIVRLIPVMLGISFTLDGEPVFVNELTPFSSVSVLDKAHFD